MGLQSYTFPVNPILHNLETPTIYIANKDKQILGATKIYDDLSITCNLNAFQTATFKIYRDINGEKQYYYDYFEEEMLIKIIGLAWFEIHVETNIEDTGITKSITATSLECKLCDKRLVDFECNAGEILYDDYVKTIFYDPTNPKGSLLHRILNVTPNWTVGHVDASLANMQRTFDVDDTDVYSFLTGEVSEAFNCLFLFDTFNQTVNAYDLDNYGNDTNIYVSTVNLAENMSQTIDTNSIFTCYRVNGGDGVYINEVNPNGTNKIYNFEYYLPQMSSEIQEKIKSYNQAYQELKPQYEDIMARMQKQIEVIQELNTRLPDSLSSEDWTQYGLTFLTSKQKSFQTQNELYCAQGMNNSQSLSYDLYLQNLQKLNAVTAELNARQTQIDSATIVYNSIKSERDALQERLDMDNWFTEEEWKSLDNYVVETTYDNDNFIVTDQEDDSERFEIERQLYEAAWKDLSKKCRPQYQYSATISNILQIPEFENFKEKFELGNFMRMRTDYDTVVKLRIISFTINFDNSENIDVTFSDAIRVKDVYEDSASIQSQANSAAISFKFNKDQYDTTVKQGNWVSEIRKNGLDVATTQIHNSSNQSQIWDETGMTFRQWNDEKQNYEPEQIKVINNMIVFSDDSFDSTRMAIGKIALGNGEYAYGINAEVLLSKLVMSENLYIENDSGTYKFDDTGFVASNGTNQIKIQPNNVGELFSIYKSNNQIFYVDSSGNLHFQGDLTGATGTFSGLVSGGSINIGNGTFTVNSSGYMNATGGTFSGNINSATISGGSINIGSGFSVDSSGNLKSISGEFSSATFTNTIFYGLNYNGQMVYYPIINVPDQGYITFALSGVHTTFPGSVQFDNYVQFNKTSTFNSPINFGDDAWRYGSASGTSNYKIYKTSTSDTDDDIPTNGWVKGYVLNKIPDTSNFATSGHTHSNYLMHFYGDGTSGVYNSISQSGQIINGSKISYSDLKDKVSDIRMKNSISEIKDITSLYMGLKPVEYRYNEGVGYEDNLQFGVIAQWTQNELLNHGYNDCGLVRGSKPLVDTDEAKYVDDGIVLRVDYSQFHALHMKMIQKHEQEIEELKQENFELKSRLSILEQQMEEIKNAINDKDN